MGESSKAIFDKLRAIGPESIVPTRHLFLPLLVANASKINSTPKHTFQYGSLARQKVDVYDPSPSILSAPSFILVFLYGGGLINGDRILPQAPQGVAYANLGHFFAQRGFTTLVADYRTVGEHGGMWPSGGEDVAALVSWMQTYFVPAAGRAERKVFLMGHSAGAIHIGSWLLAPEFQVLREASAQGGGVKVDGCILLSPPAQFRNAHPSRMAAVEAYYGKAGLEAFSLCALARAAANKSPEARDAIRLLVMVCELDPEEEVAVPVKELVETCQKGKPGWNVQSGYMHGHNHVNPIYGLSSGKGECEGWAEDVIEWIKNGKLGG